MYRVGNCSKYYVYTQNKEIFMEIPKMKEWKRNENQQNNPNQNNYVNK